MKIRVFPMLCIVFICSKTISVAAEEVIRLLTYHNSPPFIINQQIELGITYDLAQFLTQQSNSRFIFRTEVLPRKRLNIIISQGCRCVVPWVNPKWFRDEKRFKYHWTDGYFEDSNAIISSSSNPLEYKLPELLIGKEAVGLRGGRWVGLDPLIRNKKLKKMEVPNYLNALKIISAGRADFAIIPTSIAKNLIAKNGWSGQFHFSSKPHSVYWRHFMITKFNAGRDLELQKFLQEQIEYLKDNPEWRARMARYGL